MEPGVDFEIKEEKVLFTRIVVMYAVVGAVNLVSRFERIRRREALEREWELQRERIELSQNIHDTIAQSAYMIGLGLETAIELANARDGEGRDEHHDHVGPHRRGVVRPGATSSRRYSGAALLDSSQRLDQRLQALPCQ